jgi:hypothetical protein
VGKHVIFNRKDTRIAELWSGRGTTAAVERVKGLALCPEISARDRTMKTRDRLVRYKNMFYIKN